MKKYIRGLFTVIFLLGANVLYTQVNLLTSIDTSTTEGLLHYILQPLDKSQIPTGFLEEWGAPIVPMATFNGTLSDSNCIEMGLWRTLYFQLQTAYCGSSTNPLDSITVVNNAIAQNLSDSSPVPIPLLIGQYNSVKSNAFGNDLLSYNSSTNQVYDVAGRAQSPYQPDNLFAGCPDINATITGSATFICKSNLIWNNTGKSISNIQIDFANGQGFQTITLNTPVTISYTDTGMVRWTIKVTLSDDSILQCYSDYDVLQTSSGGSARYSENSFDAEWNFPANSNESGAKVFISYTSKNRTNTMRKPLIVVEGYDVYHVAPALQYGRPYTYSDIVNAINEPYPLYDFNYNLDDVGGYDLIFVQFMDGTDSIQRNARILEQIIDSVNSAKTNAGSTEQNVVMGLSMGGLVARYALAEMTKTGENPQTRLLITHDSPHRGANVPLGIQYLIEMIGNVRIFNYDITDIYPQYNEAINLLNEPATQQLLLYRATGSNTFANNTFLNGDYRNMVTFGHSDHQPAYRFIATSDGSQCGHALFSAYHRLFYSNDNVFLFIWPILSYDLAADVSAYALPDSGSTNMIANLVVRNQFKLFGFISIYKQLYSNSANAPGTQLPVDGAAGGTDPLLGGNTIQIPQFALSFPIPPVIFGTWGAVDLHVSGDPTNFCFVPTASALDIDPLDTAALSAPFVDNYNGDFISRSAAYIAQEANTSGGQTIYNNAHIQFTARNAQWLYDEMEGISNTLNCSSECTPNNNFSIQGNNTLCSSATYSVPGLPDSATVTWSVSPSGVVSLSPNGNQVTATRITNGTITLTANISTLCTTLQVQRDIQVLGVPSITQINIEENGPSCIDGQSLSFGTTYNGDYGCSLSNDGITEVDWQIMSPQPYQVTYNAGFYECSSGSVINPGISLYFSPPTPPFTLTLRARVKNECGEWSLWSSGYSFQISGCSAYSSLFSITPNPASRTITITYNQPNEQYSKMGEAGNGFIREVKIYTSSGKIVKQQQFSNNSSQVQMDVSSLSPGVYFVEISNGQHTETHKLIIAGSSTLTK